MSQSFMAVGFAPHGQDVEPTWRRWALHSQPIGWLLCFPRASEIVLSTQFLHYLLRLCLDEAMLSCCVLPSKGVACTQNLIRHLLWHKEAIISLSQKCHADKDRLLLPIRM